MYALQSVMRPVMGLILIFLVAFIATISSNGTYAQTSGSEKPVEGATPGGVNDGASSDSELWRQIRRGKSGIVAGGDKSTGLMIQSAGQDWRLIRNGPLPRYAAWAILGTLLLLSLFFALRGRIRIDHGPSGHTMKRFSGIERAGHWLLASSFIILALTGLNLIFGKTLLIPLLGKEVFASITVFGKYIHNYVGFAFMLGLLMIVVMWIKHNIPNWHDVKWLLRGGSIVGGSHPPARKFNAGQKIIFWIVVLCGVSISISGWALMNPFSTQMFSGTFGLSNAILGSTYGTDLAPVQEQQYQSLWHSIMAVFMIAVILAHIYIGSVGMEGALSAMTTGEVDTNWAREHHSLWLEEVEAKMEGTSVPAAHSATEPGVLTELDAKPPDKLPSPAPITELVENKTPPKPVKIQGGETVVRAEPASSSTRRKPKAPPTAGNSQPAMKDDLKKIKGIGPVNEKRLNAIGVKRFEDVAKWTRKEQADIGQRLAFPGRIEREDWVKQAKVLARNMTGG